MDGSDDHDKDGSKGHSDGGGGSIGLSDARGRIPSNFPIVSLEKSKSPYRLIYRLRFPEMKEGFGQEELQFV